MPCLPNGLPFGGRGSANMSIDVTLMSLWRIILWSLTEEPEISSKLPLLHYPLGNIAHIDSNEIPAIPQKYSEKLLASLAAITWTRNHQFEKMIWINDPYAFEEIKEDRF
jgi:hypothetical protein